MAKIDIQIEKAFDVDANMEDTWDFLIDTPKTVSHYPKLEALESLGTNQWLWKLEKIGIKNFSHQVIYAVEYHFDEGAGTIVWEPLSEHGNSIIHGRFEVQETKNGSRVVLATHGKLDIPVPALLKRMAMPFVEQEFSSHIEQFSNNLKHAIP